MKIDGRVWVAMGIVALIVIGAWWFGFLQMSARVALTSRSMSHADENLRGVMDPGESITLGRVLSKDDVVTAVAGKSMGYRIGDEWGDAIVYKARANGDFARVPGHMDILTVAHRAMVWVEWDETSQAYDVPELGLQDVRSFSMDVGTWDASIRLYHRVPMRVALEPELAGRHDGFLTKGDHNSGFDQDSFGGLQDVGSVELIEIAYLEGKVTDFIEPREADRTALIALGSALMLTVGVVAYKRLGVGVLGRSKCGHCGGALDASMSFCPRCGNAPR